MKRLIMGSLLVWLAVLAPGPLTAGPATQSPTPAELLAGLTRQFNRVQDYTVEVRLSIQLPRFRLPRKQITVYFKQPDRWKVETRGFALVPRTGFIPRPETVFALLQDPVVEQSDTLNGHPCWIITGMLQRENPDAGQWQGGSHIPDLRLKIWVDGQNWVIRRIESWADLQPVLTLNNLFDPLPEGFALPTYTEIIFHLPDSLATAHFHSGPGGLTLDSSHPPPPKEGIIKMTFRNYQFNRGLPDELFEDEDTENVDEPR